VIPWLYDIVNDVYATRRSKSQPITRPAKAIRLSRLLLGKDHPKCGWPGFTYSLQAGPKNIMPGPAQPLSKTGVKSTELVLTATQIISYMFITVWIIIKHTEIFQHVHVQDEISRISWIQLFFYTVVIIAHNYSDNNSRYWILLVMILWKSHCPLICHSRGEDVVWMPTTTIDLQLYYYKFQKCLNENVHGIWAGSKHNQSKSIDICRSYARFTLRFIISDVLISWALSFSNTILSL